MYIYIINHIIEYNIKKYINYKKRIDAFIISMMH